MDWSLINILVPFWVTLYFSGYIKKYAVCLLYIGLCQCPLVTPTSSWGYLMFLWERSMLPSEALFQMLVTMFDRTILTSVFFYYFILIECCINVLGLVGIELTFFIAAYLMLVFTSVLITQQCLNYCWTMLVQHQELLHFSLCPWKWIDWEQAEGLEGIQPGQLI